MRDSGIDSLLFRVKKMVQTTKKSPYFDKIRYIIGKKTGKKGNTGNSVRYNHSESSYTPSYETPNILDISSDDSGIILSKDAPQLLTILTEAVVEPQPPGLWNSTPSCESKKPFKPCDLTKVSHKNGLENTPKQTNRQREYETQEVITSMLYCTTEGAEDENSNVVGNTIFDTKDDLSKWEDSKSNFVRSVNEKFVINLYESRQSNRWKRKSVGVDNFDKSVNIIVDNGTNEGSPDMTVGCKNEVYSESESDAMFYKLKKMRDAECVKMREASNALKAIKKKNGREWSEELLTEKILLETDLKYKMIVNKIRDLKYSDWSSAKPKHTATITLSNFQYELAQKPPKDSKYSEFFILALSHDTDVFTTKVIAATEDKLVFNETFTLKNLDEEFSIRAEVFSIKLKVSKPRMITALLKKKSQNLCPIFRIYYENINTLEVQESAVLKSSFASCGVFVITKNQVGQNFGRLTQSSGHVSSGDSRLKDNATFTMDVDLQLATKLSGFLTLGKADEQNNIVFWERKWCSLAGTLFSIYNYPQDEEFARPPESAINLEYCFAPLLRPEDFPKKNAFVLKTGRPSTVNDSNNVVLRRRNNFVLEKYYLYADSREEFKKWNGELDSVLASLKEWDRLVFVDEYY